MFGRRWRQEREDLRIFVGETLLRYDRGMAAMLEEDRRYFAEADARLRRQAEESRLYFERVDAKLDEVIAEGRAGREALFRMLDRLDGNGGPAPAG